MKRGRRNCRDFTKNKREQRVIRGHERRVLYIGLDESNHGGDPEICTAVFSTFPNDAKFDTYKYGKKYDSLLSRLNTPELDYNFLTLYRNQIPENKNKLAISAPSLIIPYLEKIPFQFHEIKTLFDGRIKIEDKNLIINKLNPYAKKITCKGFIKYKEGKGKNITYNQPKIIPIADTLANHLYNQSLRQINENPQRVFLDEL